MSRKLISFDWLKWYEKRKRGAFSIIEMEPMEGDRMELQGSKIQVNL